MELPIIHFYPRPPRGGRPINSTSVIPRINFYPRPPRGGRPLITRLYALADKISIHALREEGDDKATGQLAQDIISIHALREEGDPPLAHGAEPHPAISIHALREEGDLEMLQPLTEWLIFLSTPSARRATQAARWPYPGWRISIHALREEGDHAGPVRVDYKIRISIHALREEGDASADRTAEDIAISIHALREEGDPVAVHRHTYGSHFYPRPPRGGRQRCERAQRQSMPFLSTPSARRATARCCRAAAAAQISIHALREEGDTACR